MERTVMADGGGGLVYDSPKTRGSRRRVPLPPATVDLLRDYLAVHPRADEPTAPLFPSVRLTAQKPTGMKASDHRPLKAVAQSQAVALAATTVEEAELRLDLDWNALLRHQTFYKAVYRPAVLRASAFAGSAVTLPPGLKFRALRHTYASLCVAAGIPPLEIARFMGHAKVTTTLTIYAHLYEDDHSGAMCALGAMGQPIGESVVRLRRS